MSPFSSLVFFCVCCLAEFLVGGSDHRSREDVVEFTEDSMGSRSPHCDGARSLGRMRLSRLGPTPGTRRSDSFVAKAPWILRNVTIRRAKPGPIPSMLAKSSRVARLRQRGMARCRRRAGSMRSMTRCDPLHRRRSPGRISLRPTSDKHEASLRLSWPADQQTIRPVGPPSWTGRGQVRIAGVGS